MRQEGPGGGKGVCVEGGPMASHSTGHVFLKSKVKAGTGSSCPLLGEGLLSGPAPKASGQPYLTCNSEQVVPIVLRVCLAVEITK